MNRKMFASLFFACFALPAFSEDAEHIYAQQGNLSFQLLRDKIPVNGGIVLVNSLGGFFSGGPNNFYPRVQCENGGRTLDSIQIFGGMTMSHRVEGKDVVLELAQYTVLSPEAEIRSLKENECRNISPVQQTAFRQTIRVPYDKTGEPKVVPLDNGYSFRFQTFPPLP